MLSLLFSAHEGELLLSAMDPVAGGCVPGEWPDGLTAGSELGSVSVSCCEAVADRKSRTGNKSLHPSTDLVLETAACIL